MSGEIKLKIDGKVCLGIKGETILEVARRNEIWIPTLCYDERLEPYGACRLCLVEVKGARGFLPSCTTEINDGMEVRTSTKRIESIRRTIIELLLSDHPEDCMTCESAGLCVLQDLAYRYGVRKSPYAGGSHKYEILNGNPLIERDPNKCVLCGRCVRICEDVVGAGVYGFVRRGFDAIVSTPYERSLLDSPCLFCGQCVSACPVGALTSKISKGKGRLWDVKKTDTICPYCGVGCTITLWVKENRIVNVTAPVGKGVNKGNLCVKGRFGYQFVNSPDRLKSPLIRQKDGSFMRVGWKTAVSYVAENLSRIRDKYGPDSIAGLASARCTNEENYIFQKFMRAAIGTNNIDHCARLCHSPSVAGLAQTFGSGAMTNSIEDLALADVTFIIGSNTTETHPVISMELIRAVNAGKKKLIVADPRNIMISKFAEIVMNHKPGTDVALLNGMMHWIIKKNLHDMDFIRERTEGFDELKRHLRDYAPKKVEKITGVPEEDIKKAAEMFATATRANIVYSMGITQHTTGTENVMSISNLAMLTGNIGKPGTGVNPLRGQNNVQGACDMGALPDVYSGYQKVTDDAARRMMEEAWGVALPEKPGLKVTEMVDAALRGEIRAIYVMGENPLITDPDLTHSRKAFKNLEFLVVQDIFMTETAEFADVVLPSASFAEKDGTYTNTERRVQRIRKAIEPPGEARPDWEIICEVSSLLGYRMAYSTVYDITREVARLTPSYRGITPDSIAGAACGIQWPCTEEDHPGTPILHVGKFSRGKGKFVAVDYKPPAEVPTKKYPLVLTTGRILTHYHAGSMTRRCPPLEEIAPEALAEIHETDAAAYGICDGDIVEISTRRGSIEVKAKVTERANPGVIFIPFHYAEAPVNLLTPSAFDPVCKIPEYKVSAVKVKKKKYR